MKTFKEYARMTRGFAIGGVGHAIASLGDVPPIASLGDVTANTDKGSRSYRAVGLTAQKRLKKK